MNVSGNGSNNGNVVMEGKQPNDATNTVANNNDSIVGTGTVVTEVPYVAESDDE